MNNKIIITGATGFIGKKIIDALLRRGDDITVLTRSVDKAKETLPRISSFHKLISDPEKLAGIFEGKDVVIHLAGENIMSGRWSEKRKKKLYESRIDLTRRIVEAINFTKQKPKLFISASAVGYYGDSEKEVFESSEPGKDFLANLVVNWESEASKVESAGVRFVAVRIGIVLDLEGGALSKLILPFKLFVGGTPGSGRQWVPWIHIKDLLRVFEFSIDNQNVNGPVNAVSPNPVRMKNFVKSIGNCINRPSIFKIPAIVLKLILGEASLVILEGAKVIPQKLNEKDFNFEYPELDAALKDLLN